MKKEITANSSFFFKVVCRELGLNYAQAGTQTDMFNASPSAKENITEIKIDVVVHNFLIFSNFAKQNCLPSQI